MSDAVNEAATGAVRRVRVDELTRVEGEGSLTLVVRDGAVVEARLGIFEAPRYFEKLVAGRAPNEVIDMVARICGICPVAYQMSAVHAFEDLFGVRVDPAVRALRRILYCGEWIESHALHVYMLHAPDFLGYDSAIAMAAQHRNVVERGLALKKLGNDVIRLLGGRAIHPVSVRVGGFSRVPSRRELHAVLPDVERALEFAKATVRWVTGLALPAYRREMRYVAMRDPREYFARGAWEQYRLPFTIVRPSSPVGRSSKGALLDLPSGDATSKLFTNHAVPDLVIRILAGQDPLRLSGDGSQVRNYIAARDLAQGIRLAMESPDAQNEDFNLGSRKGITIVELSERIWRKIHGPERPFRFVADADYRYDAPYRVPDVRKAKRMLGFDATTTLDQMLDEVIDWIREVSAAGELTSATRA